jgi:hypothetical protein
MNSGAVGQTYRQTIHQVRRTMAEERKWSGMPALLDELHRLRSLASGAKPTVEDATATLSREAWMTRFTLAVQSRRSGVEPETTHRTANVLWQWVGHLPPETLAEGRWGSLSRNYPEMRATEL